MKLRATELFLDEEEQFRRESMSTKRRIGALKYLRMRKTEGEFQKSFKELTDDEKKYDQYFKKSRHQFCDLLKKVLRLGKQSYHKNNTDITFPKRRHTIIISVLLMKKVYADSTGK
jgi:DNA anti-recombination protein RmuC